LGADIAAELSAANAAAREMGLEPYYLYRQKNMAGNFENVGYASYGKEGVYNILIMEEKQTIAACGAGSISKRVYADGHIERAANYKDLLLYLSDTGEAIERKRKLFEME
jgi:oxygen-independent coproporphyrinogen-3 oxidase